MDEIIAKFADMPTTIHSFVVSNDDMSYTVVLNSRLSREQNVISMAHEMKHICNGDYEKKCSVGIIEMIAHHQ